MGAQGWKEAAIGIHISQHSGDSELLLFQAPVIQILLSCHCVPCRRGLIYQLASLFLPSIIQPRPLRRIETC
jgi:hypothetical protein